MINWGTICCLGLIQLLFLNKGNKIIQKKIMREIKKFIVCIHLIRIRIQRIFERYLLKI
jgi:hypothetical protein